jgi:hypothetical protein
MRLTTIFATRQRPKQLMETLDRSLMYMTEAESRILVCIDEDDHETVNSIRLRDSRIIYSIKPREDSRGEKYDRALTEAPADLYMVGHDCAPILTKGWDRLLLEKAALFPDGIGVVRSPYINGFFPPGVQAMTAKYVEKMGYIYNPDYPFWFIDHEVHDMARLIGRYLEARIEVLTGPTRPAKTFRLRDVAFWATYYDLLALERRNKARAIIDSPDFQASECVKAHLRENYHGIEREAKMINDRVRRNAAAIEAQRGDSGPPDEGYLRAKARAEQKLSNFIEALKAA